jgi:hypothetical protein
MMVTLLPGLLVAASASAGKSPGSAPGSAPTGLHVSGNQLLDGANSPVILRGVNRSGTEYACIQGWGFFDGPSDLASVQAIASWGANAVRIPLNEDCWLNINGSPPAYSGAAYQNAIASYVATVQQAGLVPILDLHWTGAGTTEATGQQPMLNRDHSITFWQQVANAYMNNTGVIFDLHNEPYPDSNQNTTAAWDCWKNGTTTSNSSTCPGSSLTYQAAGMQEVINAVRATGATNPIMAGGVQYSNALSQWLAYKPQDSTGNLLASWHVYNFNACNNTACYDATAAPVAASVPLVTGEIGENDCGTTMFNTLMSWLDSHNSSYLAWTWDTWGTACSTLSLITDYTGTPTPYGQDYKDHLASVVNQTPDFTLSASPSSRSVPRGGGTAVYTATVTPTGGFSGTVQLTVSGLPAGSSASFNPSSLSSGNSTLTVLVPASVQRGIYTLTITGASGALRHTATVTLSKTQGR